MTFEGEALDEFRSNLAAWFDCAPASLPRPAGRIGETPAGYHARREWQRAYHEAGYIGLTWPVAYGGAGLSMGHHAVFLEEVARRGLPTPLNIIGLNTVGPTIITHGTEGQKRRFLPAILSGEEIWAQGFSEPEAGSDVSALRTRSRRTDDGGWQLTGQKIWTSLSPIADHCMVLARGGPESTGHRGISCFLVPMDATGVQVRPIRDALGEEPFGEVFFDEVSVGPDALLGAAGEGWTVALTTLGYERANLGATLGADALERFNAFTDLLAGPLRDHLHPDAFEHAATRAGHLGARVRSLQATAAVQLSSLQQGEVPGAEGSILKMKWTEINQAMTSMALELLGPVGGVQEADEWFEGAGRWMPDGLRSLANSIEGGTSEILRSLVAERVLGLPRSR